SLILTSYPHHRDLHSFPTRRSSDLTWERKMSRGPLPALRRRSPEALAGGRWLGGGLLSVSAEADEAVVVEGDRPHLPGRLDRLRSEEHTSELQSRFDLVCRLLLEKK